MFGYWKNRFRALVTQHNALSIKCETLEQDKAHIESECQALANDLQSTTELLDRAKSRNQILEQECDETDALLTEATQDRDRLSDQLDDVLEINERQENKLNDIYEANRILQDEITAKNDKIRKQQRNIDDIVAAVKVLNDVMNPPNMKDAFPLN